MLFALLATTLPSRFGRASVTTSVAPPTLELSVGQTIGAWELIGPLDNIDAVVPILSPGVGTVEKRTWQRVWSRDGRVDFGALLSLHAAKTQSVALGNWLRVQTPFDGYLLTSADGGLRVAVDGRIVYRRPTAHQRGNGLEPIPLQLAVGTHRLVVIIEKRDNRTQFSASLRTRADGRIPQGVFVVPQRSTPEKDVLERLVNAQLTIDTTSLPLSFAVTLSAKAGLSLTRLPVGIDILRDKPNEPAHWNVGTVDLSTLDQQPRTIHVGPIDQMLREPPTRLELHLGDATFRWPIHLPKTRHDTVERAALALKTHAKTRDAQKPLDGALATLEYLLTQVVDATFKDDVSWAERQTLALTDFLLELSRNHDPFQRPGWVQAAIRSSYDGQPQSLLVHVPARHATEPQAKLPLVVVLHGYNSEPRRILEAFLDDPGPKPTVDGFVIAPHAHGNAFYRGAGERAIQDAIDWAIQTYPVDENKISITGVSMGGTGAADTALRYAERFSAAAPLCGYQSFFVRRDTAGKPLRDWERPIMHTYSAASLAESGQDVPLYVAHGTRDKPLENSRVLIERYRKLGYSVEQDWPDLGHSVWKKTYRHAGLFTWLTKWTKDRSPTTVSVTTGLLRHSKKFWVKMTELETSSELPHVDAQVTDVTHVRVRTRAVSSFCLEPTAPLSAVDEVQLTIDEQPLRSAPGTPRCYFKRDHVWSPAAPAKGPEVPRKLPYVEGPWSDLLAEPVVVVYGTLNPKTAAFNELVARRLFEPKYGVELDVPVVSDVLFERGTSRFNRAIYVGRPDDHLQFGRIATRLPIRIFADRIEVRDQKFTEPDVGTVFVYPDPERRVRLLGFVSANAPAGLLRALSLPLLVPDFVVFDHGLDAAAGEVVLGPAAFVRAAGFFQSDWSLPENLLDPLNPSRSPRE